MPLKSKAQMRYLYGVKPEIAREFAEKTANIKMLPDKIKKEDKKRVLK